MSNQQSKTHYRNVFKSDHLGRADIEDFVESGSNLIFTISHVNQEKGAKVAGKRIDANIAYFKEQIKPLVLNATNSGTMRKLTGSCFVENWNNVSVQLYVDESAKLKGEVVGGVRISPMQPKTQKPQIEKSNPRSWVFAKNSFIKYGNFDEVFTKADITPESQQLIIDEVSAEASNA